MAKDINMDRPLHGAPRTITTDRGTQFESAIFDSFTKLLGCSRIRTTASNGIIECWHRSLKSAITCHISQQWSKALPIVLLGLRSAIKGDIKTSTAEMLYGENLMLPGEFLLDLDTPRSHHLRTKPTRMKAARPQPTTHQKRKTCSC